MCIGACAWMESDWLETVDEASREMFMAKRYMDDLLVFYAKGPRWDEERFLRDICEECYWPPLTLEEGSEGTFLETSFQITRFSTIEHWLKNTNEIGKEPAVWRYAHYGSATAISNRRERC